MSRGVPAGYLCPGCQTPEENAEAEVNQATLDYAVRADGRAIGVPKGLMSADKDVNGGAR